MSNLNIRRLLLTVLMSGLLAACSGGSGGTGAAPASTKGISAGEITEFGSIFVNGVKFDTSSSTITVEDAAGDATDLKLGQIVEVRGSFNNNDTGAANTIAIESAVKGPVQGAPGTDSLVVLGQTVLVSNTTIIDISGGCTPSPCTISDLSDGDHVEVNGHVRANGIIEATRIDHQSVPLDLFKVKGFIENKGASTFTIGSLTVDYIDQNPDMGDLPSGTPANGLLVEVKGLNILGMSGELLATKIEPEGINDVNVAKVELEGFVTAIISVNDFILGNQAVQTDGNTLFEGGFPDEIVIGSKLEVEGKLSAGVLLASKVSFRENIKLEGDIATIDHGAGTFTLKGLPGITVSVNSLTELDSSGEVFTDFLQDGHVRVRGRPSSGNNVIAIRLEERSDSPDAILQGPVDNVIPEDSFSILGVSVDVSSPLVVFSNLNDAVINRTTFFNAVSSGTLVKAKGELSGASIIWDEAELED